MQSINSVKEGDDINIYDEIVKFDRLLRLYRCYKKSDDSNKDSVKVQCERILNKLKKNCTAKF